MVNECLSFFTPIVMFGLITMTLWAACWDLACSSVLYSSIRVVPIDWPCKQAKNCGLNPCNLRPMAFQKLNNYFRHTTERKTQFPHPGWRRGVLKCDKACVKGFRHLIRLPYNQQMITLLWISNIRVYAFENRSPVIFTSPILVSYAIFRIERC